MQIFPQKENEEEMFQETASRDYNITLLELESYINKLERKLAIKWLQKGQEEYRTSLECVLKTYKSSEKFLRWCLIKKITEDIYTKMEKAVNIIAKRYWLITIFDMISDTPESLWERLTDGIIRSWSYDQEANYSLYVPSFKTIDAGVISISKYVADIDWLSKKELSGGYCLTSSKQSKEHNASPEAFDYFEQDTSTYKHRQMKSAKNAEFQIGNHLLKWLCFTRVGLVTFCQKTRKHESKKDLKKFEHKEGDSGFRFCVLSNNKTVASELWTACNNPMLTALIASCYIKAMAKIAENWFEDSLQRNLEDHSNLFSKRAEIRLDKLFKHNEVMATEALDHVSEVWGYVESPLHFGHQFGMEEFISHTSTQKDANKRQYSYRNDRTGNNEDTTNDNKNKAQHPEFTAFIKHHHLEKQWYKFVTAPVSRMMIDVAFLMAVLIMFSIFLMTDMKYSSISVLEWIVSVWIIGDFIEEIFNLVRPEDGICSPQRIFLHIFDIWNFMDILYDVLYIGAFIMHAVGPEEILVHTRRIYSLALFLMFLRLFNILLMFQNIGIIIIMVKEMASIIYYTIL
ncbi:unnamed protein product [Mytilus coruscus]|uniref:TRPM-like domain-containing protein n=1 Tax=Mytilus coruscus TaxID=42192 RepID=A0A6J8DUB7_MYTCO|nr:unnamed protein product [Mytilus coruscus]